MPFVGVLRCSKNPVDARDSFFQQRAKSFSLAGASTVSVCRFVCPFVFVGMGLLSVSSVLYA